MKKLIHALIICLIIALPCQAKIIYVDDDANGLNDGSTWENAYNFLQDALADADSSPKPVEIRVAQGIYIPYQGEHGEDEFLLIDGVAIKGGYAGVGAPDSNAKDINFYRTILSGDRNGDDIEVINPADLWSEPTRADNTHVFYNVDCNKTAVIDGFTITGGRSLSGGGGMINDNSSPTIINCTFIANTAGYDGYEGGGAIYNYHSNPTLINCNFIGNSAGDHCGGGAIYNEYSNPILTNCVFTGNTAEYCGGGIINFWSNPVLINCIFENNFAPYRGGGIHNDSGSFSPMIINCTFISNHSEGDGGGIYGSRGNNPILANCTFIGNSARRCGGAVCNGASGDGGGGPTLNNCKFIGNSADEDGGTMHNGPNGSPMLTNCTFSGNSALNGNAIACNSLYQSHPSNVEMTNCILWDGGDEIWNNDGSTIEITYTDIQEGQASIYDPCDGVVWGEGNINTDPCFVELGYWADVNDPNIIVEPNDPNAVWIDGDYHLKSQAGRWNPNSQSWIKDDVTSPCIDAGDPSSPIGLEPFPNGGIINMGAFGGTAEAGKSYFGEPLCETIVAGDINGNCIVNFKDFALMAYHWLEEH